MNARSPMNDDEVLGAVRGSLTAVRDSLDGVHMERPVEALVAWGRTRRVRRTLAIRAAVACATAAVTAAAVLAVTGGASGIPARKGASEAQARTVAYVTVRVENALARENLVFVGHANGNPGPTITWAYGLRSRFEQFYPTTDYRDRVVNGRREWDFPPEFRGQPSVAWGTALVGGKLNSAYVTYYNREFSLSGPPVSPPASACSTTVALSMGGPLIPDSHWSDFINATLACGAATVTGHVRIDGMETTKITGKPVTVRLSKGYGKTVGAKWARARWTLYVNPTTYLPVRMYGSMETFGGAARSSLSWSVTDVQWLPPTAANIAQALVTIPAGFRQVSWAAQLADGG
jgi:hypothetical protein